MAAAFRLPGIPVTIEQISVDSGTDLAVLFGVDEPLIAGLVGAAFGIDFAGKNEILAVGRPDDVVGFGGEAGELPGIGAVGVHQPDLGGPPAIGDVGDAFGIGGPAGAVVGFSLMSELAGLAALERDDPDLLRLLVG